jgi:hypothetical protein
MTRQLKHSSFKRGSPIDRLSPRKH